MGNGTSTELMTERYAMQLELQNIFHKVLTNNVDFMLHLDQMEFLFGNNESFDSIPVFSESTISLPLFYNRLNKLSSDIWKVNKEMEILNSYLNHHKLCFRECLRLREVARKFPRDAVANSSGGGSGCSQLALECSKRVESELIPQLYVVFSSIDNNINDNKKSDNLRWSNSLCCADEYVTALRCACSESIKNEVRLINSELILQAKEEITFASSCVLCEVDLDATRAEVVIDMITSREMDVVLKLIGYDAVVLADLRVFVNNALLPIAHKVAALPPTIERLAVISGLQSRSELSKLRLKSTQVLLDSVGGQSSRDDAATVSQTQVTAATPYREYKAFTEAEGPVSEKMEQKQEEMLEVDPEVPRTAPKASRKRKGADTSATPVTPKATNTTVRKSRRTASVQ